LDLENIIKILEEKYNLKIIINEEEKSLILKNKENKLI